MVSSGDENQTDMQKPTTIGDDNSSRINKVGISMRILQAIIGFRRANPVTYGVIATVCSALFFALSNLNAKLIKNMLGAEIALIRSILMVVISFAACKLKNWNLFELRTKRINFLLFLKLCALWFSKVSSYSELKPGNEIYLPLILNG
ncbi:hypothetical protein ACOME3_003077 [Neoechinorhynchus agilis]